MQEHLEELNRLLSEPVESVRERERTTFDHLLTACEHRVVLFGAGNVGRKALACLRSIGVEPLSFADNSPAKWGTKVEGVPVLSPEEAARRYGETALFVVTIWSEGHHYPGSKAQLMGLGCREVVPATTLRWKFHERLLPDFCQDLPHKVYYEAEDVRRGAGLWSDELSATEYLNQVRWRALGDQDALRPEGQESYFPKDVFRWLPEEVFVDCGAYTGDTTQRMLELWDGGVGKVFALEPDPQNFERLRQWMGSLDAVKREKIHPFRVAAGARACHIRFRADGGPCAGIDQLGETLVECVPLDELLANEAPTFIKMDIEGAEFEALHGAQEVIRRYQPVLAICTYHFQHDLWRIPLLLHSLCPDYRLFLRAHEGDGWQVVCYAVPPSRVMRQEKPAMMGRE